jgi:hypothetical protein
MDMVPLAMAQVGHGHCDNVLINCSIPEFCRIPFSGGGLSESEKADDLRELISGSALLDVQVGQGRSFCQGERSDGWIGLAFLHLPHRGAQNRLNPRQSLVCSRERVVAH